MAFIDTFNIQNTIYRPPIYHTNVTTSSTPLISNSYNHGNFITENDMLKTITDISNIYKINVHGTEYYLPGSEYIWDDNIPTMSNISGVGPNRSFITMLWSNNTTYSSNYAWISGRFNTRTRRVNFENVLGGSSYTAYNRRVLFSDTTFITTISSEIELQWGYNQPGVSPPSGIQYYNNIIFSETISNIEYTYRISGSCQSKAYPGGNAYEFASTPYLQIYANTNFINYDFRTSYSPPSIYNSNIRIFDGNFIVLGNNEAYISSVSQTLKRQCLFSMFI